MTQKLYRLPNDFLRNQSMLKKWNTFEKSILKHYVWGYKLDKSDYETMMVKERMREKM